MAPSIEQRVSKAKRKKARAASNRLGLKGLFFYTLRYPVVGLKRLGLAIAERPKIALIGFAVMAAGVSGLALRNLILSYHEKILPNTIVLNISNSKTTAEVRAIVESKLAEAKRTNQTRSNFLSQVSQSISEVAAVDEYWIRLGLDRRLQISATLQIPVLLVETATDKFVIGNKLKIIEKNPKEEDLPKVLRLSAPEARFKSIHANSIASRNNKYSRTPGLGKLAAENINVPWLVRQSQQIETLITQKKFPYSIDRIVWKNASGFEVIMKGAPRVVLGETMIPKKIDKLSEVFADLENRRITAESVDLNFADKALIKTSDPQPTTQQ